MRTRPVGVTIVIALGVILWLAVSVAVIGEVLRAPGQNLGLGIGIVLIWILLLVFAWMSRHMGSAG